MSNESKQALRQVFDNFDKDKSGFVDQKELILIAKELNETLSEAEVDKLMKIVDTNKDGKISFQEFWDWWQFGKKGKLEKLVFMKLKMLNLAKKINSEFTQQGISLSQKYETANRDFHYFAINYGESLGSVRLKGKLTINGAGIEQEINSAEIGIPIKESQSLQFIIIVKASEPIHALKLFQEWYEDLKKTIKHEKSQFPELSEILESTSVQFQIKDNLLFIHIEITHPIILEGLEEQYVPLIQQMGVNTYLTADFTLGIKNNLKNFFQKQVPFVKWLFGGFLIEAQIQINSELLSNIFKTMKGKLGEKLVNSPSVKSNFQKLSSKFHLTFKNMDDVDALFQGLGLQELVKQQPTGREILEEFHLNEELAAKFKDQEMELNIFYKLIQLFQQHTFADAQIYIICPYIIGNVTLIADGLGKVFDCIFRNKQNKQKQ